MTPSNSRGTLLGQLILTSSLSLSSGAALSAPPPDAGALQQQMDRERQTALPDKATTSQQDLPAALPAAPGLQVTIRSLVFSGNTLISSEQLASALVPFLNRPLDYAQLQAAAAAVAQVYRDAGWLVRSYLPQQDLSDGALRIQIVEAVLGDIQVRGSTASRVTLEQASQVIRANQATGQPLNTVDLDRGLLLADDLPGVSVTGTLRPGSREGAVDLVLQMTDEVLITGDVSADNAGARSTGSNRLGANLQLNSALGMGDLLTASGVHSEGNDYVHASATLPIGSQGLRGGASVSTLQYKLVSTDFAGLNAQGSSSTWGLEASYPLIRQPLRNLYVVANLDHKSFDNQSAQSTTSRYTVDVMSLALIGNAYDSVGGGGATAVSLVVSTGNTDLAGSPNQVADALTARTGGGFTKLRYQLSRRQALNSEFTLLAALSGQNASRNLDSSERFYLGGASGVRAYPTSEGSGSEGALANLELQWRLPSGWRLAGFYDWGQITQYRDSQFAGAPALNEYVLQGAGLALGWQSDKGVVLRLTWARRIGDNPNPTANGNDQDGSLTRDRIGFTASLPF